MPGPSAGPGSRSPRRTRRRAAATATGIRLPSASYGRFVTVTGSFGLLRFIVAFRPVMAAAFGALNMSTRSWMFRAPPSRIVARDRQIERAGEAAAQVVVARLEADAADGRPLERRGVELLVGVAAAAAPGIAHDAHARAVVRRAGQVHVAAAVLVAEADGVRRSRCAPSTSRQLPVVDEHARCALQRCRLLGCPAGPRRSSPS